ncbi:MAG: glycoside hydrolase family 3 C-terminal domain-containing protein [Cytophagales bacterium]|nr:glycoside hydrolase family 3 C-terminal domain-containing protein [Cytophagales bacterium]
MNENKHAASFFRNQLLIKTLVFFSLLAVLGGCANRETYFAFRDWTLAPEARAADLVAQMTLQEKVSQMRYDAPAIPRLNIPQYNWWNECLHGVGRAGEATVFPQAIGMGATWNTDLIHRMGVAVSDEARAKHHRFVKEGKRGIYQGLTFWTPNINIFRDPRWGRGQETYGEDPLLTGDLGVAYINGLQGDDDRYLKLVATAKHFAVHSGPEKSRHVDNYISTPRDLNETYLPAFEKAVKEAQVHSVMCAYNRTNDLACCGSNVLLDSILRQDWGFDGYIVSDCWAINDFYLPNRHEVSGSGAEASALAVKSGTDLNCGNTFDPNLSKAVLSQLIDESEVDKALTRLMSARFKLGMFDDPNLVPWSRIPYEVVRNEDHQELAKQVARESIVLLKNESDVLPLSTDLRSVAIIGPNANSIQPLLGNYHGTSVAHNTPFKAIRERLPHADVKYAKGSNITKEWPLLTPIPAKNLKSGNTTGLKGTYFSNAKWEGQPVLEKADEQIDFIWVDRPFEMEIDTFTVRWAGEIVPETSGKYRIGLRACNSGKLFLNGEQVISFSDDHQPRMDYHDIELKAGETIAVQIDYYNFHADPQVHLLWSLLEQDLLTPALDLVRQSDVTVLCLGLSPDIEGEEMPVVMEGFDKGDRSDIVLPSSQQELLKAVMATGKPVVLVLLNGSALAINYAAENVPAIVEAWYPGEFGGLALAEILFGDVNPSGKLPVTFYKSVEELPDFKSYDMTGRTYKYFEEEPLFPFGHGLSYSNFEYTDLKFSDHHIEVTIENTSTRAGLETIQVYLSTPDMANTPQRALIAFQKEFFDAGETRILKINLPSESLKVVAADGQKIDPEGKVFLTVGGKQPGFSGVADSPNTKTLTQQIMMK